MNLRNFISAMAIAGCALIAAAQDKASFTPMPLDSGFGRMDLSDPPVPPDQIIKQFAAKETEFQEALNHYTYRRTASVDEVDDDTNKVSGEWYEVDDVIFDTEGRRTERVDFAPANTLKDIMMSPSDLQDLQHGYSFVLTTAELPAYDIKYVGRQKVDEVQCYAFDVAPKTIEKGKRYFEGRIWVDTDDMQIVVTNGRMVPDDTRKNSADLHAPFITWRQQIDGHYWFPVYSKGEGVLHFPGGYGYMAQDVHIRELIKFTDYKRFGSSSKVFYNGQEVPNDGQQPNPAPTAPPDKGK
ncbi:MAG TPA: hypothetical protein VGG45_19850 [Terracidiphilus sp.]